MKKFENQKNIVVLYKAKVTWSIVRKKEVDFLLCVVVSKNEGCMPPFIGLGSSPCQVRNNLGIFYQIIFILKFCKIGKMVLICI